MAKAGAAVLVLDMKTAVFIVNGDVVVYVPVELPLVAGGVGVGFGQ